MVSDHRRTVNIQVGRKLSGKSRDEILEEIVKKFEGLRIKAVQQFPDSIRVTFDSEDSAIKVLNSAGVRLFGMWCRMDGGPPSTIVHLFDYPYEEDAAPIDTLFGTYGKVKGIRLQKYISHQDIFTGTRLIDIVIERTPPRLVSINGFVCRVWYKGQPIICNSCGAQGHKANDCPDKDKCHRCGESGHLARHCTNAWGTRAAAAQDPPPTGPSNSTDPGEEADVNDNQDPPAQGTSASEADVDPGPSLSGSPAQGASASEAVVDPGSFPSAVVVSSGSAIDAFSSSSQSSPVSISDFSSESQSILLPVEATIDKESSVESNGSQNINNSELMNESINVEGNSTDESENINGNTILDCDLQIVDKDNPKPQLSAASETSLPKSVDDSDDFEMDTSGGNRKRKPSDDSDLTDLGPPLPQRPGRSAKRTVIRGRHSGLPTVSPVRSRCS